MGLEETWVPSAMMVVGETEGTKRCGSSCGLEGLGWYGVDDNARAPPLWGCRSLPRLCCPARRRCLCRCSMSLEGPLIRTVPPAWCRPGLLPDRPGARAGVQVVAGGYRVRQAASNISEHCPHGGSAVLMARSWLLVGTGSLNGLPPALPGVPGRQVSEEELVKAREHVGQGPPGFVACLVDFCDLAIDEERIRRPLAVCGSPLSLPWRSYPLVQLFPDESNQRRGLHPILPCFGSEMIWTSLGPPAPNGVFQRGFMGTSENAMSPALSRLLIVLHAPMHTWEPLPQELSNATCKMIRSSHTGKMPKVVPLPWHPTGFMEDGVLCLFACTQRLRSPAACGVQEHAGWGRMGMAGITFRPGNGTPGHCCGLWKYNAWRKGVNAEQQEAILKVIDQLASKQRTPPPPEPSGNSALLLQDLTVGVDIDWAWMVKTLPSISQVC